MIRPAESGDEAGAERRERRQSSVMGLEFGKKAVPKYSAAAVPNPDEVIGFDDGSDTRADRYPLGVLGAMHRTSRIFPGVIAHGGHPFKSALPGVPTGPIPSLLTVRCRVRVTQC